MNLIYFELENFSSIYNATGLDKISFDRESSNNRIILVLGSNGSGKSSILDELTPIPLEHTNFRNKSRILKNKVGKKIIIYKLNNDYFKCSIIYDKKTVCYFSKSADREYWEELNKNGNVNTYLELLESYLGFSKNYVKVGYLSSAISNFIVMKPSERNEYISEWLPNIDIYLKAHKLVNTKYNQKKKEIDMLNRELGKMTTIDYENEIKNNRKNLSEISIQLDVCNDRNSVLSVYLNRLVEFSPQFDKLNSFKRQLKNNKLIIEKNKKEIEESLISNKEILKYSNDEEMLKKLLVETELELVKSNETFSNLNLRLKRLKESITSKENNLGDNSFISDSLIEVNTRIKIIQDNLITMKDESDRLRRESAKLYYLYEKISFEELFNFISIVKSLGNIYKNILSIYDGDISPEGIEERIKQYRNKLKETDSSIEEIKTNIENTDKMLALSKSNDEFVSLYNLKPINCTNKTCNLLAQLEKIIEDTNDSKNIIEMRNYFKNQLIEKEKNRFDIINYIEDLNEVFRLLVEIDNILMEKKNEIASLPEELVKEFMEINKNKLRSNIEYLFSHIDIAKAIVSLNENLKNSEVELSKYEALKIKIISKNQLEEEYEEYKRVENAIELINSKISSLEEKLSNLNNINSIKEKMKENIDLVNKQINQHNLDISNVKELTRIYYYFNAIKNEKANNLVKLQMLNNEKAKIEKEFVDLKSDYANKTKLETLRNEGLKVLKKYKVLSDTWSPKIGYASWEISAFLDILKNQTNRDLEEMWGSELKIDSFNISLNEFSIKINKNGNIIDDAILCSSGEQATLVTAISFAIIALNASSKMYNVLRLDEVDAVLDTVKRRGFMDILIDRIEKMNCQSCFVVTHNNEFDTIEADVILMSKVNDINLDNKNVIFSI